MRHSLQSKLTMKPTHIMESSAHLTSKNSCDFEPQGFLCLLYISLPLIVHFPDDKLMCNVQHGISKYM